MPISQSPQFFERMSLVQSIESQTPKFVRDLVYTGVAPIADCGLYYLEFESEATGESLWQSFQEAIAALRQSMPYVGAFVRIDVMHRDIDLHVNSKWLIALSATGVAWYVLEGVSAHNESIINEFDRRVDLYDTVESAQHRLITAEELTTASQAEYFTLGRYIPSVMDIVNLPPRIIINGTDAAGAFEDNVFVWVQRNEAGHKTLHFFRNETIATNEASQVNGFIGSMPLEKRPATQLVQQLGGRVTPLGGSVVDITFPTPIAQQDPKKKIIIKPGNCLGDGEATLSVGTLQKFEKEVRVFTNEKIFPAQCYINFQLLNDAIKKQQKTIKINGKAVVFLAGASPFPIQSHQAFHVYLESWVGAAVIKAWVNTQWREWGFASAQDFATALATPVSCLASSVCHTQPMHHFTTGVLKEPGNLAAGAVHQIRNENLDAATPLRCVSIPGANLTYSGLTAEGQAHKIPVASLRRLIAAFCETLVFGLAWESDVGVSPGVGIGVFLGDRGSIHHFADGITLNACQVATIYFEELHRVFQQNPRFSEFILFYNPIWYMSEFQAVAAQFPDVNNIIPTTCHIDFLAVNLAQIGLRVSQANASDEDGLYRLGALGEYFWYHWPRGSAMWVAEENVAAISSLCVFSGTAYPQIFLSAQNIGAIMQAALMHGVVPAAAPAQAQPALTPAIAYAPPPAAAVAAKPVTPPPAADIVIIKPVTPPPPAARGGLFVSSAPGVAARGITPPPPVRSNTPPPAAVVAKMPVSSPAVDPVAAPVALQRPTPMAAVPVEPAHFVAAREIAARMGKFQFQWLDSEGRAIFDGARGYPSIAFLSRVLFGSKEVDPDYRITHEKFAHVMGASLAYDRQARISFSSRGDEAASISVSELNNLFHSPAFYTLGDLPQTFFQQIQLMIWQVLHTKKEELHKPLREVFPDFIKDCESRFAELGFRDLPHFKRIASSSAYILATYFSAVQEFRSFVTEERGDASDAYGYCTVRSNAPWASGTLSQAVAPLILFREIDSNGKFNIPEAALRQRWLQFWASQLQLAIAHDCTCVVFPPAGLGGLLTHAFSKVPTSPATNAECQKSKNYFARVGFEVLRDYMKLPVNQNLMVFCNPGPYIGAFREVFPHGSPEHSNQRICAIEANTTLFASRLIDAHVKPLLVCAIAPHQLWLVPRHRPTTLRELQAWIVGNGKAAPALSDIWAHTTALVGGFGLAKDQVTGKENRVEILANDIRTNMLKVVENVAALPKIQQQAIGQLYVNLDTIVAELTDDFATPKGCAALLDKLSANLQSVLAVMRRSPSPPPSGPGLFNPAVQAAQQAVSRALENCLQMCRTEQQNAAPVVPDSQAFLIRGGR